MQMNGQHNTFHQGDLHNKIETIEMVRLRYPNNHAKFIA